MANASNSTACFTENSKTLLMNSLNAFDIVKSTEKCLNDAGCFVDENVFATK